MRLGDGVVLSGDWDADFFDNTTRTDRVLTSWPTARGELFVSQWQHHTPFRARISFRAKYSFSIRTATLTEPGTWKMTLNGVTSTLSGSQYLTLNFPAGTNTLTISKGATGSERIHFDAILFDGKNSVWIPQ